MDINCWYWWTWLVRLFLHHSIDKIMLYLSGSLAISYAVAMGFRVLAIVAPNDKVKTRDKRLMGNDFFFYL